MTKMTTTMKTKILGLLVPAALVLSTLPAASAERVTLHPVDGSEVRLEGTSNLHDWEAAGAQIDGLVEVEAAFLADFGCETATSLQGGATPPRVQVAIPARSLESDKRRLNRLMYDSLEADDHPLIRYTLTSARLLEGGAESARLATEGELEVAGVTRRLEMEVLVERLSERRIAVSGSVPLLMTDFGIDPPRALLGTLRTADELTATFRWVLEAPAGGGRR